MIAMPCEHCGVQFDAESANVKAKRQGKLKRFCSRRCRNLSRPTRPERPPEFFQRPCGVCGVIFDATPSRPKYEQPRKYCRGCVREGRKAKIQQHHVHCNELLQCEFCKAMFKVPKRMLRSGKHSGRFCSLGCAHQGKLGKSTPGRFMREVGTRKSNAQGYVLLKTDARNEWTLEHRHVMGQFMGRPLHPWENVHHLDGNRQNNDRSNLELWVKTQPTGMRFADLVEIYGAELLAARLRIRELEVLSHRPL